MKFKSTVLVPALQKNLENLGEISYTRGSRLCQYHTSRNRKTRKRNRWIGSPTSRNTSCTRRFDRCRRCESDCSHHSNVGHRENSGGPWHSWAVVACTGMSIGHKGILYAAKPYMTMADLYKALLWWKR